jgi:hypothetical protein
VREKPPRNPGRFTLIYVAVPILRFGVPFWAIPSLDGRDLEHHRGVILTWMILVGVAVVIAAATRSALRRMGGARVVVADTLFAVSLVLLLSIPLDVVAETLASKDSLVDSDRPSIAVLFLPLAITGFIASWLVTRRD